MNTDLIIDIFKEYDITSPTIYLYDALDEIEYLNSKKINIDNDVIKGYLKKYWPRIELKNIDKKTVASFGDEWSRFDQYGMTETEAHKAFSEYFSVDIVQWIFFSGYF